MNELSFLSANEVQENLCECLIEKRKAGKLSRDQLAQLSTVPTSTIKKFEITKQISFRQFILLWQSLDDLSRLNSLTKKQVAHRTPTSIDEVCRDNEL